MVLENVPALLYSNDHADFEIVIRNLAECGYVGYWRIFNAQYFGVAQNRRRIFLVGGLGRYPSMEFLADAAPVESVPCSFGSLRKPWRQADAWAGHTLQATNSASRITLGSELLVAESGCWDKMVERQRASEIDGLCAGLDAANLAEVKGAGNAVVPQIAQWIAEKLV